MPCALTFDVEDWFHAGNLAIPRDRWASLPSCLARSMDEILALLAEYDTQATFFVLGWVASRDPDLVRTIHDAGHEIASHGYWHEPVTAQPRTRFRRDLLASKRILEEVIAAPVAGYRAPGYSINREDHWALDELLDAGFSYDSSIYPAQAPHRRYGVPGAPLVPHPIRDGLWEFPLPTLRVLGCRLPAATGAYLRLSPFVLTRWAIEQNLRRSIPVVINLHPWELDPHQPFWSAPLRRRWLHYTNLRTTRHKLVRLLETYPLGPLRAWAGGAPTNESAPGRPAARAAHPNRHPAPIETIREGVVVPEPTVGPRGRV